MAKRRDIVIAIVIIASFIFTIGFFAIIMVAGLGGDGGDFTLSGFGSRVAVIEIYGGIYDSREIIRQLNKWAENDNVKAIVLHVDSPGGAIAPSQEIYNEIIRIREEYDIPIVVSAANVAASGGDLVSCAADRIMANPGSIMGSIGVILSYPTAGKLFEKIGVKYEAITSGDLKDVGAFDRDMTTAERKMLTNMVMDAYEQFVEAVAESREMDKNAVYELADGSIYSGRQAYYNGLVDTLGGFEDAIRLAAELGGIEGEPKTIKEIEQREGFFDLLGSLSKKLDILIEGRQEGPRVLYLY